jgi:hypothetical protein
MIVVQVLRVGGAANRRRTLLGEEPGELLLPTP